MPVKKKPARTKKPAEAEREEAPKREEQPAMVVTEVVEEVSADGSAGEEVLHDMEDQAKKLEKSIEELEKDIAAPAVARETAPKSEETAPPAEPETEPDKSETAEEKERPSEVVEELFKPARKPMMPELDMYERKQGKRMLLWVVIVIGVAALTGTVLIGAVRGLPKMPSIALRPTPTPTPAPPTPTPTPAPPVRSDISLQVLNGGGVPGAASKMKSFLEAKGYTVSGVGNTDSYTYDKTAILVKPEKASYLPLLKSDLEGSYTIGTAAATLSSGASYDAQVIVGKE
ncbi:LytR C-terminal domain-containing protein [Patescibacteria group bacterium]|nr:LytR C-terminal domain-containing protein [Patescibacteria group bacterium]